MPVVIPSDFFDGKATRQCCNAPGRQNHACDKKIMARAEFRLARYWRSFIMERFAEPVSSEAQFNESSL